MARLTVRWWQWLTILSLDAPLVALLWQALFARAAGVALGAAPRFVLGSSVWLSYVGDRWFEGWRLDPAAIRTPRHLLYHRRRWWVSAVSAPVIVADLEVAFRGLPPRDLHAGFWLLLPVLAYLLSHQLVHRGHPWRMPKELCVALLFGAGSALFVLAPAPGALARIALPLALFTVLCFANCALISVWEREVDLSHDAVSLSRQFRGAAAFSRVLPWVLATAAALGWRAVDGPARAAVVCAGASSALLGAVDRLEPRLGRLSARVLADVVLMTPAVALIFPR